MTRRRMAIGALPLLAASAFSCAEDASASVTEVTIAAIEEQADGSTTYRFDLPEPVPAGPTRISLRNEGAEPHHAQLFRLADDATIEDLAAALATGDPAAANEFGSFAGGTALVDPGETSRASAVIELEPGEYALICFVPGVDGAPHLAHGMLRGFDVVDDVDDPTPSPAADQEIRLVDFGIVVPESLDGDALVRIVNDSTVEPHEMIVARLDDGAELDDVRHALDHGAAPPVTFVGGMQALPPGASAELQLALERGRYVLICEVPSPDGTPHRAKGMIAEVTVE